jgi:Bifunctional DNA primase/polymerase, N-terminal
LTPRDYAQRYVEHGMVVLPLRPLDKEARQTGRYCTCTGDGNVPLIGSDPRTWEEHANVGVVCGQRSRLMVLDVDVGRDGHGDLAHWRRQRKTEGKILPDHAQVVTATGGRHHWFRLPDGMHLRRNDYWLPGVEVKACGGYVASPPSVRRFEDVQEEPDGSLVDVSVDRAYEWDPAWHGLPVAPDWLLEDVQVRHDGIDAGRLAKRGGVKRDPKTGEVSIRLPPTEEFEEKGLGWFYMSRNVDAFHLACRLWTKHGELGEDVVIRTMRRAWNATDDKEDSSWDEILGCVVSARSRMMKTQRERERRLDPYRGIIDRIST